MFSDGGSGRSEQRSTGRATGRVLALMVALFLPAFGCEEPVKPLREWTAADHGHSPEADPSRMAAAEPSAPEEGGAARAAQSLWNVSCAGCHGRSGRGDGPTPPPGAQLPDLTRVEFQAARSDAQLAAVIRSGRSLMPAFGTKLGPEAIDALVAHVRSLGAPQAAPEQAAPQAAPEQAAPEAAAGSEAVPPPSAAAPAAPPPVTE